MTKEIVVTPKQIQLVQSTWAKVLPIKEIAAQLFYDRLFDLDPSLKALFRGDIHEQGRKLMQVMDGVVTGLSQVDRLEPIVRQLGQRHVGYGVEDRHYLTVGEALLWTLDRGLKEDFTEDVRAAWAIAYDTLTSIMRDAAVAAHA
jgi:hemoglobin-like flavoprotein